MPKQNHGFVNTDEHRGIRFMRAVVAECDFIPYDLCEYSDQQIKELYLGIEGLLKKKEILLFVSPYMTANQMHQIRMGFVSGLSFETIESYANPKIDEDEMRSIRQKNISEKKISHRNLIYS